jgi:hypothetical protein
LTVSAAGVSAPVTSPDTYVAKVNQALTVTSGGVLSNDYDPSGQAMAAAVLVRPTHGTISLAVDGTFIYVPQANYAGMDSFTYVVSDRDTISGSTTVQLTVVAPTVVTKPTVRKRTRTSYKVTGSVKLGYSAPALASTASSAKPVLRVLVQRRVNGQWRSLPMATIRNASTSYSLQFRLKVGGYRVRTSISGGGIPSGLSPWASFRVR